MRALYFLGMVGEASLPFVCAVLLVGGIFLFTTFFPTATLSVLFLVLGILWGIATLRAGSFLVWWVRRAWDEAGKRTSDSYHPDDS